MKKIFKLWNKGTKEVVEVQAQKQGREWMARCPEHNDGTPSLSVNEEKRVYFCHACGWRGHLYDGQYKRGKAQKYAPPPPQKFLNPKLADELEKQITPKQVEAFSKHFNIPISILYRHRIGMSKRGEYTFPIFTIDGKLTDIRRRMLKTKPKSWPKSKVGLFGIENLRHRRIFICEGETDTMTLEAHRYHAVGLPGVGTFKGEWVSLFKGKEVFICFDLDTAGREGAMSVGKTLLLIAKSVRILRLPSNLGKGGDVRKFFNR